MSMYESTQYRIGALSYHLARLAYEAAFGFGGGAFALYSALSYLATAASAAAFLFDGVGTLPAGAGGVVGGAVGGARCGALAAM